MATVPITLEEIVARTTDLPSFSQAALRVMRLADKAEVSADQLAEALAQDQSLTTRVLRLANSAYYGVPRQITHLSEAVIILGLRTVKNLSMVAATYPWLSKPLEGYALAPKELWHHSFGTALGSKLIAELSGRADPDEAFTAGLLHDIGKVALNIWIGQKLRAIIYYAERESITFDHAERRVLGFDHTEVGEHLALQWNLPDAMVKAVRYHHSPNACDPPETVVDCVHVGGYLTMAMGFGLGGDGLHYEFFPETLERLHVSPDDLDSLTDNFVVGYESYETLFQEMAA